MIGSGDPNFARSNKNVNELGKGNFERVEGSTSSNEWRKQNFGRRIFQFGRYDDLFSWEAGLSLAFMALSNCKA